jgi:hypothetical protein
MVTRCFMPSGRSLELDESPRWPVSRNGERETAPVWSTGAAKCEYSKVQNGNLSRHQFDDSSGIFQARQRAVGR